VPLPWVFAGKFTSKGWTWPRDPAAEGIRGPTSSCGWYL
jgi:hypothetical protein